MRTTRTTTGAALAAVALAAGLALSQPSASAHDGPHPDPAPTAAEGLTGAQRQVIREATKRFADVDVALAAGYLPSECAEHPELGGMGMHYVNPPLMDGHIDPTMPEILLYAPTKQGPKLVGVEYFAPAEAVSAAPTLMGHVFEGPMDGHEPGMPVHYDLHAWVFTNNPSGELATWNSAISCS